MWKNSFLWLYLPFFCLWYFKRVFCLKVVSREISIHLVTTLRAERPRNQGLISDSEGIFYCNIDIGSRAQTPHRWIRKAPSQAVKDSGIRN
jgi:hypothetical protein